MVNLDNAKASSYALVRKLSEEFKEMNTTTIRRELKGLNGQPVKRSCDGCIKYAAKIYKLH